LRCFLHISEFGFEGYRHLPALATISDDLVLWAPAALQAQRAKDAGASLLGADEILELVEARKMRIVGREHYLLEKESRKNGWPLAQWTQAYDAEIARIALADREKPPDQRRVFFAEAEQGKDWAEQELARGGPRVAQVEELIEKTPVHDPMRTNLLPGLAEKLTRLPPGEERVALALRDIRNHTLAAEEVGADISVEPLAFRDIAADLGATDRALGLPASPPPTIEGVRELLAMVMSLAPLRSSADLQRLLDLREVTTVRHQIESLLRFNPQPQKRVEQDLEAAGDLTDWLGELLDPTSFKGAPLLDVVGVVLAMLGEPALAATGPLTRLGCALGRAAERRAKHEAELDAPIPYSGSRLPFLLAFGDETVTFRRIGDLRRRLEDPSQSGLLRRL
jgi:hypothetical protein